MEAQWDFDQLTKFNKVLELLEKFSIGEYLNFLFLYFFKIIMKALMRDESSIFEGIPCVQKVTPGNGIFPTGTAAEESVVITGEDSQLL